MDRDLVLLTISFDPKYDTPRDAGALRASQRAGGPGWHFLTGDPANIERVCNAFGIQYWAEEGLITHSLQTAVIDRDGRLAATVEGQGLHAAAARRSGRRRARAIDGADSMLVARC